MENEQTTSAVQGAALSRKGENILAGVLGVSIIALILIIFGYRTTELWLTSPIVWNDPDSVYLQLWEIEEPGDNMKLTFNVFNLSNEDYTDYTFYAVYGTNILEISSFSNPTIRAHDGNWLTEHFARGGSMGRLFNALSGKSVEEINEKMTFHVKALNQYGDNGYEANSWLKIVLLLVLSVVCGVLILKDVVRSQPLRIAMKVVCVPALLAIVFLGLFLKGAATYHESPQRQRDLEESNRRRAAEYYKEKSRDYANAMMGGNARDAAIAKGHMDKAFADLVASNQSSAARDSYKQNAMLRAGAAAGGNMRDAARAQGQMDKAFADMIAGNHSSTARDSYKQSAAQKAAAAMSGNTRDAARAQGQMDKALADMLRDAGKE